MSIRFKVLFKDYGSLKVFEKRQVLMAPDRRRGFYTREIIANEKLLFERLTVSANLSGCVCVHI